MAWRSVCKVHMVSRGIFYLRFLGSLSVDEFVIEFLFAREAMSTQISEEYAHSQNSRATNGMNQTGCRAKPKNAGMSHLRTSLHACSF